MGETPKKHDVAPSSSSKSEDEKKKSSAKDGTTGGKDAKPAEVELSEEDLQLKTNLELLVQRVMDSKAGVAKLALESMRTEIKTATRYERSKIDFFFFPLSLSLFFSFFRSHAIAPTTDLVLFHLSINYPLYYYEQNEQFDDFGAETFEILASSLANFQRPIPNHQRCDEQETFSGCYFSFIHDRCSGRECDSRVVEV